MKKIIAIALFVSMLLCTTGCSLDIKLGEKEDNKEETKVEEKDNDNKEDASVKDGDKENSDPAKETAVDETKPSDEKDDPMFDLDIKDNFGLELPDDFELPEIPDMDLDIEDFESVVPESIVEEYPELQYFVNPDDYAVLAALGEDAIGELVAYKDTLVTSIKTTAQLFDIDVNVDEKTGVVTFNADILFDFDKSDLKDDAKTQLKKFINVYSKVIIDTGYHEYISDIMIEGHTDSNGGDKINIPLSLERANAVKDYIVSDECGLTDTQIDIIEDSVETVGCASQRPVLDENGNEDAAASRRVTFRFVFDLEEMIEEATK